MPAVAAIYRIEVGAHTGSDLTGVLPSFPIWKEETQ